MIITRYGKNIKQFSFAKAASFETVEVWMNGKPVRCARQIYLTRCLPPSKHVQARKFSQKLPFSCFSPLTPLIISVHQ